MPEITVIIINHGDEATLPRALASLTLQSVDMDVVLVADGPDQRLNEIAARFPELAIRNIENDSNVGRGASRQRALDEASGRWVTFLDADDWYLADKLQQQLDVVRDEPELGLVSTDILLYGDYDDSVTIRRVGGVRGRLARQTVPFAPSLIRAPLAKRVGFDPTYRVGEDRAFLDSVLHQTLAYVLQTPLYVYHQSSQRSLVEEFSLRRAHVRQEVASECGDVQRGAAVIREASAGFVSQVSQRTGHWLEKLRRTDVSASGSELSIARETASRIRSVLLARGFSDDSAQLIFD